MWFRLLAHDEPQKAYQLTVAPPLRHPFDHRLWAFYRVDAKLRQQLEGYVKSPWCARCWRWGPRPKCDSMRPANQLHEGDQDMVTQLYAVTYEEEGERQSFFVAVTMLREKMVTGEAAWRILGASGPVPPGRLVSRKGLWRRGHVLAGRVWRGPNPRPLAARNNFPPAAFILADMTAADRDTSDRELFTAWVRQHGGAVRGFCRRGSAAPNWPTT